jgi:ABC-type Na+ efflux pump permease subunit
LLAAPIPRGVIVAGNLAVAVAVSLLQVGVLLGAALARGTRFDATGTGIGWFVAAVLAFTVFAYSVAEMLANRIPSQEEYVGLTPVVAIVPWFLAGSFFHITAMPVGLAAVARVLPTTHALALLRYGLLDRHATALHDIWGVSNTTMAAMLSLVVLVTWAVAAAVASTRVFDRAAIS